MREDSTSYLLVNRLVLARILGEINVPLFHIKRPLSPFRLFVIVISQRNTSHIERQNG